MNITSRKIFTTVMQSLQNDRPELKLHPYRDTGLILIYNEDGMLTTSIKVIDEHIE